MILQRLAYSLSSSSSSLFLIASNDLRAAYYCYFFVTQFFFSVTKNIKMFVLDEADEMLSRGFKDQIYDIFTKLPTNVQVWQSCSNIYAPQRS